MFSFAKTQFDYEPYPIGYSEAVFDPGLYSELCTSFPDKALFKYMPKLGKKYSLSETNHPDKYAQFIQSHPLWRELHGYIKSDKFIDDVLGFFEAHHVEAQPGPYQVVSRSGRRKRSWLSRLANRDELRARFEFSMMDPKGGHIRPHTDSPVKMITLVFSVTEAGEWNDDWGGGTQICWPKDRTRIYNQKNAYMDFDEVDILKSFPFLPNQCISFVKTYNSWHQVAPIEGGDEAPERKTLTINIDRLP